MVIRETDCSWTNLYRLQKKEETRVPNSVLGKPGELTEEEWKKMKEHRTI